MTAINDSEQPVAAIFTDTITHTQGQPGNRVVLELDARGLACPLPLLKSKLELHKLQLGEQLRVLATDRGSVRDFHAFERLSAHRLIYFLESEGIFEYVWEKG